MSPLQKNKLVLGTLQQKAGCQLPSPQSRLAIGSRNEGT